MTQGRTRGRVEARPASGRDVSFVETTGEPDDGSQVEVGTRRGRGPGARRESRARPVATRILSIQNRQRVRAIDIPRLRRILRAVLKAQLHVAGYELGLHLVGAREMTHINQTYLQHEGSTDVITFDHSDAPPSAPPAGNGAATARRLHGEIFISVADAVAQAREFGTRWQAELIRYAVHGLLHLLGHDDLKPASRRVMKRAENQLMTEIAREHSITRLKQRTPKEQAVHRERRLSPVERGLGS